jgi:hypothetical protein
MIPSRDIRYRMGKRQIRIPGKNIPANTAVLSGKEVNLLLKDKTVFHGVVTGWNTQALLLKDMRLHTHTFPFNHIEEVILDNKSVY